MNMNLHVLLHFLDRGQVLALHELGSRPFLGPLLHRLILSLSSSREPVPTMVFQEPVPSSSQSCRLRSSAAQPLRTGHTHVAWSLADDFAILRVTTVHPASLDASRNPGVELIKQETILLLECLIVLFGPAAVSLVSSPSDAPCSRSLTHPSLEHNLTGCPVPTDRKHVKPFPCLWPFSTHASAIASSLIFSMALPASPGGGHCWELLAVFCLCGVPCHCPPVEVQAM